MKSLEKKKPSNKEEIQEPPKELVFNEIYKALKKISSGSFGTVYSGINTVNNKSIALKLEKNKDNQIMSVLREATLLKHLQNLKGIPKLYWSGSSSEYDVIVLSLLGRDLSTYLKLFKKFSLKSVVMIGSQLLNLIEKIHQKSIVHRDLKPENILVGYKDEDPEIIYIVDFGISKFFRDSKNRHIPYKENKSFMGTTRYASLNAHLGIELTRKDDLETIGYIMVYLFKGVLPWQNLNVSEKERTKLVGNMKEKIKIDELCKDMPEEFSLYFQYVKGLTFQANPEYSYLKNLMKRIADKYKIEIDNKFDWTSKKKDNNNNNNFHNNNNGKNALLTPKTKNNIGNSSSLSPGNLLYIPSLKSPDCTYKSNISYSAQVQINKNLTDFNSIINGYFIIKKKKIFMVFYLFF